ncbi:hypothetical protein QC764_0096300 [Podospora pseudoanserina]|uniref:Uncharacterized protein n=1 Tax=Podospora pseudoanserina TaxID=2609844 RepID=A0ABR0HTX8_9PEZI|nr:hypothetical protein QC764_0096300 [Podospora pseudoanserina]
MSLIWISWALAGVLTFVYNLIYGIWAVTVWLADFMEPEAACHAYMNGNAYHTQLDYGKQAEDDLVALIIRWPTRIPASV